METANQTKSGNGPQTQPLPALLALGQPPDAKPAKFKDWQKLPPVWIEHIIIPPPAEDLRDWGINE